MKRAIDGFGFSYLILVTHKARQEHHTKARVSCHPVRRYWQEQLLEGTLGISLVSLNLPWEEDR